MPSFDIVSEVDAQEVDNAVNQALREVGQRFDFKGSNTIIERDKLEIRVETSDETKLKSTIDVLQTKLAKRDVPLKALDYGKIEAASGQRVRQVITVRHGIPSEKAKEIVKLIKDAKLKVQAQIQGEQVRVTGKKRDDLQVAIQTLKSADLDVALQFTNFRE